MDYRPLGRTGLEVSEIGYGAWGIGKSMWIGAEDDESLRALERAIDLGLTFIDTALAYGDGHSERFVGRIVRKRSETVHGDRAPVVPASTPSGTSGGRGRVNGDWQGLRAADGVLAYVRGGRFLVALNLTGDERALPLDGRAEPYWAPCASPSCPRRSSSRC